jgi:cephalosporin-C deacetylase-like acetyl esterase
MKGFGNPWTAISMSKTSCHAICCTTQMTSLDSQSDFEAHRERIQSMFLSRIGDLPDRPEHLSTEITNHRQREGYAIELITFESRQNFHVTTNCYVPNGDGPHPGILFLCGHAEPPKADLLNQKACIELALHGFIVLIVDPIGQGERKQYRDLEIDGTVVSPHSAPPSVQSHPFSVGRFR